HRSRRASVRRDLLRRALRARRGRGSREGPGVMTTASVASSNAPATLAGVRLTHPGRKLYAEAGISKRALAGYYLDVAAEMLPPLLGRPLSVVRCPRGEGETCFYQKHFADDDLEGLELLRVRESAGYGDYAAIVSAAGLVQLVQL